MGCKDRVPHDGPQKLTGKVESFLREAIFSIYVSYILYIHHTFYFILFSVPEQEHPLNIGCGDRHVFITTSKESILLSFSSIMCINEKVYKGN